MQSLGTIIAVLAPAFAIGVAVQRLIDILETWLDLDAALGKERKAAILSAAALGVGVAIAFVLDITVIKHLGGYDLANWNRGLDRFITGVDHVISGLIISAGTEGFNSILKWLLYAKETKKGEAVTQRETARSVTRSNRRRIFTVRFPENLESKIASGDPEADLKTVLHDVMKDTWRKKFVEDGWQDRAFKVYEPLPDRAKIIVGDCTETVAAAYGKELEPDAISDLRSLVDLGTTPKAILPEMYNVLLYGQVEKQEVNQ